MEKSIMDLMSEIRESFGEDEVDLRTYSPLTLAYIGDAVHELVIRSYLVGKGNAQAGRLHKKTSDLVKASAQSADIERIKPVLTEEEMQIYKRGRNAGSQTMAKHATMSDYRRATGFEALLGYLYLSGRTDRLLELIKLGMEDETCAAKS